MLRRRCLRPGRAGRPSTAAGRCGGGFMGCRSGRQGPTSAAGWCPPQPADSDDLRRLLGLAFRQARTHSRGRGRRRGVQGGGFAFPACRSTHRRAGRCRDARGDGFACLLPRLPCVISRGTVAFLDDAAVGRWRGRVSTTGGMQSCGGRGVD